MDSITSIDSGVYDTNQATLQIIPKNDKKTILFDASNTTTITIEIQIDHSPDIDNRTNIAYFNSIQLFKKQFNAKSYIDSKYYQCATDFERDYCGYAPTSNTDQQINKCIVCRIPESPNFINSITTTGNNGDYTTNDDELLDCGNDDGQSYQIASDLVLQNTNFYFPNGSPLTNRTSYQQVVQDGSLVDQYQFRPAIPECCDVVINSFDGSTTVNQGTTFFTSDPSNIDDYPGQTINVIDEDFDGFTIYITPSLQHGFDPGCVLYHFGGFLNEGEQTGNLSTDSLIYNPYEENENYAFVVSNVVENNVGEEA